MKFFFICSVFATLLLSNSSCSKNKSERYKGKLEVAGICMNYTIRVLEGNMDSSLIMDSWIDPTTNQTHTNVFRLANPCDFPAGIKQGDEFYFTLNTTKEKNCVVCMAYYPTPSKTVSIKVVE